MNKILFFLLVALLVVISVDARSHPRRRRRYFTSSSSSSSSAPTFVTFAPFTKEIEGMLGKAKLEISIANNIDAKQAIVLKYRNEMFSAYDKFLKGGCGNIKDLKQKTSFADRIWANMAEHLYKLDKLNYHNGCLISNNQYPSVVYH